MSTQPQHAESEVSRVVASEEKQSQSSSETGVKTKAELPDPMQSDFPRGARFWAIIIGLGVTNLLGALENTVVSTAGPTIVTDLEIGEDYVWITNAFFLCRYVTRSSKCK